MISTIFGIAVCAATCVLASPDEQMRSNSWCRRRNLSLPASPFRVRRGHYYPRNVTDADRSILRNAIEQGPVNECAWTGWTTGHVSEMRRFFGFNLSRRDEFRLHPGLSSGWTDVSDHYSEDNAYYRAIRSPGSSSGSSSYSSSSSSSSSSGGGGGGGLSHGGVGAPGGFFQFPTPVSFYGPGFGAPMYDFAQAFQQFLASAQAAHAFAAQNPAYAKIFQQQMQLLAQQQQLALAQFPFAFPGFESNSIAPSNYGSKNGVWQSAPAGSYGTGGGSGGSYSQSSSSSSSSGGGGHGGYGTASVPVSSGGGHGGYGAAAVPVSTGGGHGAYGTASAPVPTGGGHNGYGSGGVGGYGGSLGGGHLRTGSEPAVFTTGSISIGPQGGFAQAASVPGGPDGLGVRISEEFPAPSGGSFGTFSSSSSGVSSVDGKTTSFKTSTVGVNDNGKITFRTVNE